MCLLCCLQRGKKLQQIQLCLYPASRRPPLHHNQKEAVRGTISLFMNLLLSTEWVDYVEEPMKYQALRPHFSLWMGGWRVLDMGGWVGVSGMVAGGWVGVDSGGMGGKR